MNQAGKQHESLPRWGKQAEPFIGESLIPPGRVRTGPASGTVVKIGSAVLALLLALGIWHEISVLASRGGPPPLSCQFLGGQWNIFTGWQQCAASSGQPVIGTKAD